MLTLAASSEAARTVEYEGEVLEEPGTPFMLSVGFRDGHPWGLISFASGQVALACDTGTQMQRTRLRVPPTYRELRQDGYFSWTIDFVDIETGTHDRRDRVRGTIQRNQASGFLRIQTFEQPKLGDCDSGRLDWSAERIR